MVSMLVPKVIAGFDAGFDAEVVVGVTNAMVVAIAIAESGAVVIAEIDAKAATIMTSFTVFDQP